MTDKRKAELLDQIIGWACEHDTSFVQDMCNATDMTPEEAIALDLEEYNVGYDPSGDEMVAWADALDALEHLEDSLTISSYRYYKDQIEMLHRGNPEAHFADYDSLIDKAQIDAENDFFGGSGK